MITDFQKMHTKFIQKNNLYRRKEQYPKIISKIFLKKMKTLERIEKFPKSLEIRIFRFNRQKMIK